MASTKDCSLPGLPGQSRLMAQILTVLVHLTRYLEVNMMVMDLESSLEESMMMELERVVGSCCLDRMMELGLAEHLRCLSPILRLDRLVLPSHR